jgi:hypothetical protein
MSDEQLVCPHCGSMNIDVDAKRIFSYGCFDCRERWAGKYVLCDDLVIDAKTGKFIGYKTDV